jgi:hypothetical protein
MASWINEAYAYPLDYELVFVEPKYVNCKQARASKAHLKELLMHTYQNRAEVKQKAYYAARVIPSMCSWDSVIEKLFLKISDLVPEKGEKLLMKSRMCERKSSE